MNDRTNERPALFAVDNWSTLGHTGHMTTTDAVTIPVRDRFHRTFGPVKMEYLENLHVGRYVAVHCVARGGRVAGYLRTLEPQVDAPAHEASQPGVTAARPSVRKGIMEVVPGTFALVWADVNEQVTTFDCQTCIGQMFYGWGGPAHDPQPTCRSRSYRAHCSCRGCW